MPGELSFECVWMNGDDVAPLDPQILVSPAEGDGEAHATAAAAAAAKGPAGTGRRKSTYRRDQAAQRSARTALTWARVGSQRG